MSTTEQRLYEMAHQLGRELKSRNLKLVLAESCTGGVVSMVLADVPGISEVFCGSAVTYRDDTKLRWLGVPQALLENPRIGAVSPQVAEAMCLGVLEKTPEADLAVAVSGHLGPNAPPLQDGMIYIGIAQRNTDGPVLQRRTLTDTEPTTRSLRHIRQREAAGFVLEAILQTLARSQVAASPASSS